MINFTWPQVVVILGGIAGLVCFFGFFTDHLHIDLRRRDK